MISRLSALAATFAVLATATLAYATSPQATTDHASATAKQVRIVQLQHVVVSAKRLPQAIR